MELVGRLFKSAHVRFLVILLFCLTMLACGSSKKIGTVSGMALDDGGVVVVVKLDDGTEVNATPLQESPGNQVVGVGGQKVEIEPTKDPKRWRVVRFLEQGK